MFACDHRCGGLSPGGGKVVKVFPITFLICVKAAEKKIEEAQFKHYTGGSGGILWCLGVGMRGPQEETRGCGMRKGHVLH